MAPEGEVAFEPPSNTMKREEIIGLDDRLKDIMESCPLWAKVIPFNLTRIWSIDEQGEMKTNSVFWQFSMKYVEMLKDLAKDHEGAERIEVNNKRYAELLVAEKELFEKTLEWMLHYLNKKVINYPKIYPQLQEIRKDLRPLKKKDYTWVIDLEKDYQPLLEKCNDVYDLYVSNRRRMWLIWFLSIIATIIGTYFAANIL